MENIDKQLIKPDLHSYEKWFQEKFGVEPYSKVSSIYEFVISKLLKDLEKSDFWKELNKNFSNYNDEYYLTYNYPLLKIESLQLLAKPYKSLINKSFRKNILQNDNFPDEPINGWISPDNWFTKINDLIRTTITVRYLDGVKFIVDKIQALSQKHDYVFLVDYEAREEGYYAAHITTKGKFIIVDNEWKENEVLFPVEIQVTTQLQEVIKGLLRKMYEETRISSDNEKEVKWQWDYKSLEFSSNYLGHILHYVEGMILEVRDKQKRKDKNETRV